MKIGLEPRCKRAKHILFFMAFATVICVFASALTQAVPVFEQKASHAAKLAATDIINRAADDVFGGITAEETVNITTNEDGAVTSVRADTAALNKLKTELSKAIQRCTAETENTVIYIPTGSLTPYEVLQGIGHRIPVRVALDGFSELDFQSEFESVGINQVKHKIYMNATVNVSVISAIMTRSEKVTAEIPVSETVIVGGIPDYYGTNMGIVGR